MGMLGVVFNIEVGNYYSKSTFSCIMTLTKQVFELVFILVILYRSIYAFFTKLFMGTWVSEYFQFQVSGSQNNRKCTALKGQCRQCKTSIPIPCPVDRDDTVPLTYS